jgi:hypothetical protein
LKAACAILPVVVEICFSDIGIAIPANAKPGSCTAGRDGQKERRRRRTNPNITA